MSRYGSGLDTSLLTAEQREIVGRAAFAHDRLSSFTAYILGPFLDTLFLGVIYVIFCFWYIEARPSERLWTKILVYWLVFAATCATTAIYASMVVTFGQGFGEYRGFFDVTWFKWFGMTFIISRIPASIFYLHRAWIMIGKRSWIIVAVVPLLYVKSDRAKGRAMMFAVALAPVILFKSLPYSNDLRILIATGSSCEVAQDLILTCTIAWRLYRSRTGWRNTDFLIRRLLVILAETQAPPTIMALSVLMVFAFQPNSTIQILFLFNNKIHVVCILVSLLSRIQVQQEYSSNDHHTKSTPITTRGGDSLVIDNWQYSQGSQVTGKDVDLLGHQQAIDSKIRLVA